MSDSEKEVEQLKAENARLAQCVKELTGELEGQWLKQLKKKERAYWDAKSDTDKKWWYDNIKRDERVSMLRSEIDSKNRHERFLALPSDVQESYLNNLKAKADAAMIQASALKHITSKVDEDTILLQPPRRADSGGDFLLGRVAYGKTDLHELYLTRENLQKHIGIFAITGAGKTNVCFLIVKGLLKAEIPFLVIDWKRSYRELGDKRLKVYSIGRRTGNVISWNPLRPPPGVHPRTWISIIAEVLEKSHLSGPGAGDIFHELLDEKFAEFGFYGETPPTKYPNFYDIRDSLAGTQNRGRRMLWQDTAERIVRTLTFGPAAAAFNARNPIEIEKLLDEPVIFELDQELPRSLRTFFSETILRFIHLLRLHQGESPTLKHVIVLEEIHNLFPKTMAEKQTTSGLETVFKEIRSFGQGSISITQNPSLLPTYLLGNTNTLICLALQHADDVEAARKAMFMTRDQEKYFSLLKVGEGIVRIQGRISPTYVKFPLVKAY